MAKLILSNATDSIDLDSIAATGYGIQATSGLTGLGMAPRTLQWTAGAGDGARFRGTRVNQRSMDIKLDFLAADRAGLKALIARMELMLADQFTVTWEEDDGSQWTSVAAYSGGFDPAYGVDTIGSRDLQTVITIQFGDPYWTSTTVQTRRLKPTVTTAEFLTDLSALIVSDSSTLGDVILENPGTAPAYPVWTVEGPCTKFIAVSPTGQTLSWTGTLAVDESVVLDTQFGTVIDDSGVNRYADLDAAPRFWAIPPGTIHASLSLLGTTVDSKVICNWRARKYMVI